MSLALVGRLLTTGPPGKSYTSLEIIKHNMLKMLLFSSIFTIKMVTQKFTNFDKFFKKMHVNMTAHRIQSKKLFQMKLKTKALLEHLKEKTEPFGPPNTFHNELF